MALTWASDSATWAATDLTEGSDADTDVEDLPEEWQPLNLETEFVGSLDSPVLRSAWRWLIENRTAAHAATEAAARAHALVSLRGWYPIRFGEGGTELHRLPPGVDPISLTSARSIENAAGQFKVSFTINPRRKFRDSEAFQTGSTAQVLAHEYAVHGLPFLRSIVGCRQDGTAVIEDELSQHQHLYAGQVADYEHFRGQVAHSSDDFYDGFAARHERESPGRPMPPRE